ncbi:arsenate reductase family protein [Helicobacter sp. 12S02232-10]|uniref:arsenate reductase family protein n=1 Tax=Helicobacter sp. 12S02232-10 TaxID=1476197 RepID=UPI000BA69B67|nr:arsenate reductase family protein [Helicobacter sp. 12S02232-10]PAF48704.1 arsenate reductase family protein [Helicobacter sp. 12S02232-10]
MRLYGIKNCGSVQKARNFLDARNISYEFIDLKILKPSLDDIKKWVQIKGIDIVLNSKGTTYKRLGLKNMELDLNGKIEYCYENPLLLKRPIIDQFDGNKVIIGFNEQNYQEIFGAI